MTKPSQTPATRPVGRPSKYDPKYCAMVEADMAQGYSLTAFAGLIGVDRKTLDNWAADNPEFLLSVTRAKAMRLRALEGIALNIMSNKGGGPGAGAMVAFALRNYGGEEWSAPEKHEVAGKDGAALQAASPVVIIKIPDNGRDDLAA